MTDIVKDRLSKVKVAELPPVDDKTTTFIVPKKCIITDDDIIVGNCFLVELEDYIIHPYEQFDLHINWNNGIVPKDKYMKCEIVRVMNKMIKINGIGVDIRTQSDTGNAWEGWIPRKSIKFIKRI